MNRIHWIKNTIKTTFVSSAIWLAEANSNERQNATREAKRGVRFSFIIGA
jgi:hypothetical protein